MDDWKIIAYKVAVYMFFFEVRPLESYLTAYLTGPNGNVSLFEVANWMESVRSYSALTSTIIMLVISERFYKPVILAFTFCSFVTYLLMIGSPGLTQLRMSVAGIGATSNAYILGFSYLYAQIDDKKRYQEATGIVSVSLQLGNFVGCVLSQTVVVTSGGTYTALPYINTFAMFLAIICVCLFPAVRRRHSFLMVNMLNENTGLLENTVKNPTESHQKNKSTKEKNAVEITLKELWLAFKTSYFDPVILKRSFWYIIRMAAHSQVITNMNVLYTYIVNKPGNHDVLFNGYVEAMVTLCGAASTYLIGKVRLDWTYHYYGDAFTAFCSIVLGILMMTCYFYDHLIFVYVSYIMYGLVFQMALVLNFSEVAKRLQNHCYSLVLGFNLFGSLLTSAILTIFFVQINFLDITIPGRFLFIGGLDIFLGIVFSFLCFVKIAESPKIFRL